MEHISSLFSANAFSANVSDSFSVPLTEGVEGV